MKVLVFNTKKYDQEYLDKANEQYSHELHFIKPHLERGTAKLAAGYEAVCAFVNDTLDAETLQILGDGGVKLIALRCAGFNNVDLVKAEEYGITVLRVPEYSPHGVAEHALALILALNRKIYRAHNRVRDGNFSLDGLLGFEIHGTTIGVIGTGKIGFLFARIMQGLSAHVIAYDKHQNEDCVKHGIEYVPLEELYQKSDIISLHVPLLPQTHHIINEAAIKQMKDGVMIINTSRGGLINTVDVIAGLKSGKIGYLGLDVYEEEGDLFFEDLSNFVIQDDVFSRLLTFPNVIVTGHQAFFTQTALQNIAQVTLKNIKDFEKDNVDTKNIVSSSYLKK